MAEKVLTSDLFDSLSKGSRVRVSFTGGMSSGTTELVVGRKSRSNKWGVDSLALDRVDANGKKIKTPSIAKIKLMRRDRTGNVSMALGNMGCVVTAFEVIG